MSLRDASVKMSKSAKSDSSRINLCDAPEVIKEKIAKAKTDSIGTIVFDETRPEIANLITIYSACKGISPASVQQAFVSSSTLEFKEALSQVLIDSLSPIRQGVSLIQTLELMKDEAKLKRILTDGKDRARAVASTHMREIKEIIGYLV